MHTHENKGTLGDSGTPRKVSKRMEKVRKASSALGFPIVRSSGSAGGL